MPKGRPPSLSIEAVREIRSIFDARRQQPRPRGPWMKSMARRLNVSPSHVKNVARRESYRWVV